MSQIFRIKTCLDDSNWYEDHDWASSKGSQAKKEQSSSFLSYMWQYVGRYSNRLLNPGKAADSKQSLQRPRFLWNQERTCVL